MKLNPTYRIWSDEPVFAIGDSPVFKQLASLFPVEMMYEERTHSKVSKQRSQPANPLEFHATNLFAMYRMIPVTDHPDRVALYSTFHSKQAIKLRDNSTKGP